MKKLMLFLAIVVAVNFSANAQNGIQENSNFKGEKARIKQGVKSGEITKAEGKVLKKQAIDTKKAKRAAAADGVVTKREKVAIEKQDRQLDRTIRRTKNNKRDRN